MQFEGWGGFAEGRNNLFTDRSLAAIGNAHGKSVAQVVLRWLIQRAIVTIPKSVRRGRMEQNLDVLDFTLADDEMARIATMDTGASLFFNHRGSAALATRLAIGRSDAACRARRLQGNHERVTPADFVPEDFAVPEEMTFGDVRLVPLGLEHNAADYAAWTSSIDHIRATPGFAARTWPVPMTVSENLRDLEQHAEDFRQRQGFTYTVLEANDDVVGCVYIYPSSDEHVDAEIRSWVSRGPRWSGSTALRRGPSVAAQ